MDHELLPEVRVVPVSLPCDKATAMKRPDITSTAKIHGTISQGELGLPEWCDLTLALEINGREEDWWSFGKSTGELRITREGGQALLDELWKVLRPNAGEAIVTIMERRLDEVVRQLMENDLADGETAAEVKFMARGMAMMIAILRAPVNPDWEAIRDAAVARYNARPTQERKATNGGGRNKRKG